MNSRSREGFYLLWTIAILICLAVCVFVLAYFSFIGGDKTAPAAEDIPPAADGALPEDQAAHDAAQAARTEFEVFVKALDEFFHIVVHQVFNLLLGSFVIVAVKPCLRLFQHRLF